jgi:hypothetical protein
MLGQKIGRKYKHCSTWFGSAWPRTIEPQMASHDESRDALDNGSWSNEGAAWCYVIFLLVPEACRWMKKKASVLVVWCPAIDYSVR